MLLAFVALLCSFGNASGQVRESVTVSTGHSKWLVSDGTQPYVEVSIGFDEVFAGRVEIVHAEGISWTALVDPSGRIIDLTSLPQVQSAWGVGSRELISAPAGPAGEPAVDGALELYTLNPDAIRGQYTLRFGIRAGSPGPALAVVSWESRSNVGFVSSVGRNVRPNGVPLRVSAGLFVNGAAPPNPINTLPPPYPTVTATLVPVHPEPFVGPPAPEVVIALRDDGVAPDLLAADGTFAGDFGLPPAGLYDVRFQASGQVTVDQGGNPVVVSYVRSDIKRVEILGNGGGPAGFVRPLVITDVAQDFEPDGLWNRIAISVPVNVNRAGQYLLRLALTNTNGRALAAEGTSDLQVGSQTVVAGIPPSELFRLYQGGPFVITRAELFAMEDGRERLVDAEVGMSEPTDTYDIYRFQRAPFLPMARTTFTPVSAQGVEGEAPYGILRAQLPMMAAFEGQYRFLAELTAKVTAPDGTTCEPTIVWADGEFQVGPEHLASPPAYVPIVIQFDGRVIGEKGISGPYTLQSLSIRGITGPAGSESPAARVRVNLTGSDSSAFIAAAQFLDYAPMADCNGNGVPDNCDLQELENVDLNVNGVLDACEVRGCNPADIADTDGNTVLTGGGPDGQLNNGDFSAFFAAYFISTDCSRLDGTLLPCSAADITNTDGQVHPAWPGYGGPRGFRGGGPDRTLDNGDFQAFFTYFFQGCGLSGPSGQGGIEGGGGELMSRILSLLGEGEESIGGINLGALPPAVIAQRIEMLRSLGRPITVEDFKAVAPELFAPPESPDR